MGGSREGSGRLLDYFDRQNEEKLKADGEERTQKEVADILGISQSYISRLEKKIMQRLKREMVKYS